MAVASNKGSVGSAARIITQCHQHYDVITAGGTQQKGPKPVFLGVELMEPSGRSNRLPDDSRDNESGRRKTQQSQDGLGEPSHPPLAPGPCIQLGISMLG